MKYRFISDHRETFKVGRMCKLLNVSRSSYYAWLKQEVRGQALWHDACELEQLAQEEWD